MVIINGRKKRPENDFYPTPFPLAVKIIESMDIPASYSEDEATRDGQYLRFLDPGCGDGVFGRAIRFCFPRAYIMGIDIVHRMPENGGDYDKFIVANFTSPTQLSHVAPHNFDYIVGNPPYSLAEEFILQSVNCLNKERPDAKVCFLLKLAFLESKKRAAGLFKTMPPSQVKVLAGRPSFTGNGKTNDYAFALFSWGHINPTPKTTFVSWLEWS